MSAAAVSGSDWAAAGLIGRTGRGRRLLRCTGDASSLPALCVVRRTIAWRSPDASDATLACALRIIRPAIARRSSHTSDAACARALRIIGPAIRRAASETSTARALRIVGLAEWGWAIARFHFQRVVFRFGR